MVPCYLKPWFLNVTVAQVRISEQGYAVLGFYSGFCSYGS